MYKEAVICVITVIGIIILNVITGNYTKNSVEELSSKLTELREEILEIEENEEKYEKEKDVDSVKNVKNVEEVGKKKNIKEEIQNKVNKIHEMWKEKYDIFAYYLEHDELEKVANSLTGLRSTIDTEEYSDAITELDECDFVLHHIQDKNCLHLKNIF